MSDVNPRLKMGDNSADAPDYAKQESERLQRDYAELTVTVDDLTTQAEALPEEIPDTDGKGLVADLIKRLRDTARRADALREVEKQPHFRRGQGVDQFFFGLIDRVAKRDRKGRDGVADILQTRLTKYDTRVLLEEQERLRKIAVEAARVAAIQEAKRVRLAQQAETARLAAERARKPETTAAKVEAAEHAEAAASSAAIESEIAGRQAEDTYVDTLRRPADIMRTRTGTGTLSTVAREFYAEIEDVMKLDPAALWPYIALAEKEKALRAWAKATGYKTPMAGAKIGDRPKSVVR